MPDELHRIEWHGNLTGQYRANVMHMRIAGATNDTPFLNSQALGVFLDANIKPLFLLALPQDYILDALFVRRIGPTSGPYSVIDYAPGDQTGQRGANSVSEQLCPCVTLIPPMDVKSAGRIFLPAVGKLDVNMNAYSPTYVTAVSNLINALIAGGSVAGGSAVLTIFSRKLNTNNTVAAFHLSSVIGYQRRRARPVGS